MAPLVLVTLALAGCGFSLRAPAIEADASDPPSIDAPATDAPRCATLPVGPCPENYVFVPQNCAYNAGEFCIAKYEMKNASGTAVSQSGGTPWGTVTTAQAKAACAANGARYHLVTNDEWMATARAIEATPLNWSTTATPFLSKGRTDACTNCPGNGCPGSAAADTSPCFATNTTACADRTDADFRFNRTHRVLANGLIWDFSGNMFELIDRGPTTNSTEGAHPGVSINSTQGTNFSPPLTDADYKSATLAHRDDLQNIGVLYVTGSARNMTRGGDYCGFAGIYSVSLLADVELGYNVGFRCAYQ